MCYSSTASFIAATLLLVFGWLSYREARGTRYDVLALFPLFFGVQQGFEGFVWLAIDGVVADVVGSVSAYLFLSFAVVLWPVLFATAAARTERGSESLRIIQYCVGVGVAYAVIAAAVVVLSDVSFAATGGHITYDLVQLSFWESIVTGAVYTGIAAVPLYFVKDTNFTVVGSMIVGAGVVSRVLAAQWFISIWCFWAAVISSGIYYVVTHRA